MINLSGLMSRKTFDAIKPIYDASRNCRIESDDAQKEIEKLLQADAECKNAEYLAWRIVSVSRAIGWDEASGRTVGNFTHAVVRPGGAFVLNRASKGADGGSVFDTVQEADLENGATGRGGKG